VTADQPPSQQTIFRLNEQISIEHLPECALLFSEQDQQIRWLNDSSLVLAERLLAGATRDALAHELSSRGVEFATAIEWVRTFLGEMSRLGLLVADCESPPVHARQRLRVAGQSISLHYASADLAHLIAPAFAHLEVLEPEADHHFDIFGNDELLFMRSRNELALVTPRRVAAVRLKGLIVERALAGTGHLAALHAACLEQSGRMVLLLGSPGAGKTILTLALLKRGFRYGSDDVTLVKRNGEVEGVPIPLGVKESAWPIVDEVTALPAHVRPDGQQVRFLPLTKEIVADAAPVATVVRLKRSAEQSPELERISAHEGLAELFRESLSDDGDCSTEIMRALTEIVRNADCFELRYSDAIKAASFVFEQIAR
jgi:hypothetical protein